MSIEPDFLLVHVVIVDGSTFNGSAIPPELIAGSINSKVRPTYLPWKNKDDQYSMAIFDDSNNTSSFGRELAVSSGWEDEGLIVIYYDEIHDNIKLDSSKIDQYLDEIAQNSFKNGTRILFEINALILSDTPHETSGLRNVLNKISSNANTSLGLTINKSAELICFLKQDAFIRELCKKVEKLIAESSIAPMHKNSCPDLVENYIEFLRLKGFCISFNEDTHLDTLASRIALLNNEKYVGN